MTDEGGIPPTPPVPPTPEPPGEPPIEPPGDSDRPGNPWERRDELGFAAGLIESVKAFIVAPGATFAKTKKSGDVLSPMLFAVILWTTMAVVGQVWSMLFGVSLMSMLPMPSEAQNLIPLMIAGSGFSFLAAFIITPILTVIGLFIGGGILHLMLLLVGGLGESSGDFETSLRVVSFSAVAQVAQVVPGIGGMITFIWTIFLVVIGIKQLHGTSDGKAIAAVLLPILFCCACGAALASFGVLAALSGFNN